MVIQLSYDEIQQALAEYAEKLRNKNRDNNPQR